MTTARSRRVSSMAVGIVGAALWLGCGSGDQNDRGAPAASGGSQLASDRVDDADGAGTTDGQAKAAGGSGSSGSSRSQAELVAAGRSVYNANCIACHAMDPQRDGALGPAVAGASYELLEARVVDGGYPEGYEPKRPTRVMVPLPHLAPRLEELAAYLASFDASSEAEG